MVLIPAVRIPSNKE